MNENSGRFKASLLNEGMAENTISTYIGHIGRFQKWCVDSLGAEVDVLYRENFLDFRSYLLNVRQLSPASINQYIAALAKYNQFLIDEEKQDSLVITRRDHLKVQESATDPWDGKEIEVAKLRQSALSTKPRYASQNKRDYAIVTVMANCGLRVSETVNLQLADLSLENKQIRVIGKGGKSRVVFINDKTVNAIEEYLATRSPSSESPFLFLSRQGPKLNRRQINRILENHSENIHPHLLRHFYCSQTQKKAGFTIAETANQAGHSNLKTTLRYTHPDANEMKEKVNRL